MYAYYFMCISLFIEPLCGNMIYFIFSSFYFDIIKNTIIFGKPICAVINFSVANGYGRW